MSFKVLKFKDFKTFEQNVITMARMKNPGFCNFTSALLNPIREQMAKEMHGVDKVYLEGSPDIPKDAPVEEKPVVAVDIPPDHLVEEKKPVPVVEKKVAKRGRPKRR